jgi:hypothetical protein
LPVLSGLARYRNWLAGGGCHYIPQCLVERQIRGSLGGEIPETSSEGHASGFGQYRRICVGNRAVRTFYAHAGPGSGQCCPHPHAVGSYGRHFSGQPLHAANLAITFCFRVERLLAPGR